MSGRTRKRKRSSSRRSRKSFLRRWFDRLAALLVILALGLAALAVAYQHHVVKNPGGPLERASILAAISQESPVYYRDGSTKLGVFFDEAHRQYVPYEEIPEGFVHAIVASEDKRFFEHPGFDGPGIARAMVHNIQAGKVVEGGSTITQQTAENLFFAQRAFTWKDKAREAVDALRLEHHYTKEDILEFYSNQFYVNGNGRGLGIAARYFFDKDVAELDVLECAFLAGVVQSPSRFDPFIGDTADKREDARRRAHERTAYVLDRMVEDGYLGAADRAELADREIPFDRGRFRYPYDVILEAVARELGSDRFLDVLDEHGIDNPSTAGIEIVTTLDPAIQTEALYGLRHHLTDVGVPLEGVTLSDMLGTTEEIRPVARADLRVHSFHWGKVVDVDAGGRTMTVDLGGVQGTVDAEGCTRLATLLERSDQRNRWSEASRSETTALLKQIERGRRVWVSIRTMEGDRILLDVETLTELQGGVIVLQDGAIRAMVGGNRNRDFNRALQARRQFGSTFKPLVYYAALQLGWSLTEPLDNRRDVFPFEGSFYYPRPDHQGAPDEVSLAWAGVTSENVASVWLLYHLTDHLNEAQFAEVAELAGLTRQRGESRDDYIARIRDREGIIPTEDRIREGLFDAARQDVRVDLQFDGRTAELEVLDRLHYGLGFRKERGRQGDAVKRAILDRSFLRLEDRAEACAAAIAPLRAAAAEGGTPEAPRDAFVGNVDGRVTLSCGEGDGAWQRLGAARLAALLDDGELEPLLTDDAVMIEGQLSLATVTTLRREVEDRLEALGDTDLYEMSTLSLVRDFRTLVAMRYVIALARRMGVRSELATGLSLPLGSSDITLEELALMYQCLADGRVVTYHGRDSDTRTVMIGEIRLRDGTVVYRAEGRAASIVPGVPHHEVGQVLRNVVLHGTGKRAASALPDVPLAGKTGTTNSYRNAAFAGVVPAPVDGGWSLADGMVVTSYVGYDDNRKMSRGSIRLAGATGSLPAWLGAARGVASSHGDPPAGLALVVGDGLVTVQVDPSSGLPLEEGSDGIPLLRAQGKGGVYAPFEPGRNP